jgi:hypothetical protein
MTSEVTTPSDRMAAARAAKAAKAAERAAAPPEPPKPMTDEEIERKRSDLLAAIADLPAVSHPGLEPGTRVGEGLKAEYVDFTHEWFEDVEARRKDRMPNGTLKWPTYSLRELTPSKNETITVQGVPYAIYAGLQCKLPDPHYHAWLNAQKQLRKNDEEFSKPDALRDANAMTRPHMMGSGPIRDRQA